MTIERKETSYLSPVVAQTGGGVAAQNGPLYSIPTELVVAIEGIEAVDDERSIIKRALTQARSDAARVAGELETARERLAEMESAAVLSGTSVDQEALRAVTALRDSLESAEARVRGLQRRTAASEEAMSQARVALDSAWLTWRRNVGQEIFAELQQAGEAFRERLQLAAAIGTALDIPRVISAYRDAVFPDPMDPRRDMLNHARYPWRDNPSAAAMFKSLSDLRLPIDRYIGRGTPTHAPAAVDLVSDAEPAVSA